MMSHSASIIRLSMRTRTAQRRCGILKLSRVLMSIALTGVIVGAFTAPVRAQSATASQVVKEPAGRAPFVTQPNPVEPTPDQLRMREEGMRQSNRPGPPLPVSPGFVRQSPALPATTPLGTPKSQTGSAPNSQVESQSGGVQAPPPGPNDMTYFLTHSQAPFSGQQKSTINEPSVGTQGSVVFESSNWDAAYSADGGHSFTFVNPYTTFPSIDGGFCCDQTVTYARLQGTMIWQLQYNYSATTQKNTYRIAFAPAASVATSGWCYYDWKPSDFGQPAGANFDYPDVSLSNNYVWFQTRIFGPSSFIGTLVFRMPLAQASACQTLSADYLITDSSHFTVSLAKGVATTMYFFTHNNTSSERVYTWAEGTSSYTWNDFNVTTWTDNARTCPGPDGLNWCGGRANPNNIGRTSWVAGGVIGTMWNASQDATHNYPYERVVRIDESTKTLINEPDIFNASHAFMYPSVSIDARGHIGGVVFYGGGTEYPSLLTLIDDDLSSTPPPWEVYYAVTSVAGATAWGDYSTTRKHATDTNTWVGTGQYMASSSIADTYYVWFGRGRDAPPPNVAHDFNGDGNSDIAWRNTNGDVAIWLMNGTQVLSAPDIGNVPTSWSIVGQRRLNNSGDADLIWRNTNGDLAIWFMNGTQVVSTPGLGNVPTSWSIAGTSAYNAYNANPNAELIWRNTNGDVAIWLMNGAQLLSGPGLGNVPTNWTIVGTGDFSGTGNTDILWRDTAGDVSIWFMNGTQVVSTPGLGNVPTSWAIVGTGDFNGDGKTDILWRNTNGDVAIWLMNGTQVLSSPDIGNVPTNWTISETGDFNGDGKSDILWRDTAGDVAIWFMNGTQVVSTPGLGNVPTSWTIQGANAD
jgi:FG-GAP-like repeat